MTRLTVGVLVLGIGAFGFGCGGGGSDSTASDTGDQASATPATRDACALVDVPAIEAIAGIKLVTEPTSEGARKTGCELRDASNATPVVYVTVLWSGGKEQAQIERAGMGLAAKLMNEPGIDIAELTGSTDQPGLADDAFYSNLMPSWVLKGDVMIQVLSPMFNSERTKQTFMTVAKTAVSRL